MTPAEHDFISFPIGALNKQAPVRLHLLHNDDDCFAVNKPPGVNAFPDTRMGGGHGSIVQAARTRLDAPGFQRLKIQEVRPLNLLDRDVSGVFLCAKSKSAKATLKNGMGSMRFRFVYHFISRGAIDDAEVSCELPLAFHHEKMKASISHKSGKKTQTFFRRLAVCGGVALWEAASHYDRVHQVRIHAMETGVPIAGDQIYGDGDPIRLCDVRPMIRGTSATKVLYDGISLHLAKIELLAANGERRTIVAPYPKKLAGVLKTMGAIMPALDVDKTP